MDLHEFLIKQENNAFDEDKNENYLQFDFEIGVKVESDSPVGDDWCLENSARYQDIREYADVKEESEILEDIILLRTCSICFRTFADSNSLYRHNLTHLGVVLKQPSKLYQCDHCLCYYTSKVSLIKHIQVKHFMEIRYQKKPISKTVQDSQICKKTFTYNNWHSHMREVHCTERIECNKCNRSFKCWKYLRRHLLYVHEDVKPSWRFHKVALDIELKCELCPSVFRNKSSYTTHIRNCHSTNVHKCSLCNSKLKSKSYLDTHMRRVHFNDGKLHKCDICNKIFKSPRYLNIHKKNSHYVKVITK